MKKIFLLFVIVSLTYSGERKVLVEMFTNSHCGVCPGAHAAINSYKSTSANAAKLRYIYYHTTFPYGDDPLSVANTAEPAARYSYYGSSSSTPITYFDGVNQGQSYSSFPTNLNARVAVESPLDIILTGTKNGPMISVTAAILQTISIAKSDLVVHFVAVENVSYAGRNGVSPQDFVMRKMITPTGGEPFTPELNFSKSISKTAHLTNITSVDNIGVVVFVQSISSKEIFQSEYVSYATLTGVEKNSDFAPQSFSLEQNYPNPFNPSTTISFSLPGAAFVSLKVYDVLGAEVATFANGIFAEGTYSYQFSASSFGLASGIYLYRLEAAGQTFVRKMTLLK